jgi:small subunit ribosomal protein S16
VVADSRAPRDGRYIERIGFYNPNTNPATINLDFDKAYDWLTKGAQPTDTVRAILSYKGVLYKKHLMGGVKKGAFDEEEAQSRFEKWITEKESQIRAKKESIENDVDAAMKKLLAAETKKKEERAAELAARNAELAKEAEANIEVKEEEVPSEEGDAGEAAAETTSGGAAEETEKTDSEKQESE